MKHVIKLSGHIPPPRPPKPPEAPPPPTTFELGMATKAKAGHEQFAAEYRDKAAKAREDAKAHLAIPEDAPDHAEAQATAADLTAQAVAFDGQAKGHADAAKRADGVLARRRKAS